MGKKRPTTGDVVTCRYEVHPYYSAYGGKPAMVFRPGMEALVHNVVPKVCITGEPPVHDRSPMMLVCDYVAPETEKVERVSLNYCNAVLVCTAEHEADRRDLILSLEDVQEREWEEWKESRMKG